MTRFDRLKAHERIDRAIHELHQAELDIRAGRAGAAQRLHEIGDELVKIRDDLRRS